MKAFLIGLLFLVCLGALGFFSVLLMPFLFGLAVILRMLLFITAVVFLVWLLGKFIIWAWEELTRK